MNGDLYTYIQEMHKFVESQKRRIDELEKTIKALTKTLEEVKARPPINVGTIEYKFDQLKVETLDGTLNIGLNPSDLEEMDEFKVDKKSLSKNFSPQERMETAIALEDSIYKFLENDLRELVKEHEKQLEIEVEDSYIDFIREDIKRQLPDRIEHYLKKNPVKEPAPEARMEVMMQIEKQMKEDIENAVFTFLSNLPKQ